MADIFVSYARGDRKRAETLVGALRRHGWSVWWDRIIPPGLAYDKYIQKQIDEAKCVLVAWSTKSIESDWVLAEAEEALNQKKLIPIRIEGVLPPLRYRRIQSAELIGWNGDESSELFQHLLEHIESTVGKPTPDIQITKTAVPFKTKLSACFRKQKSRRWLIATAAGTAGAVAAGAATFNFLLEEAPPAAPSSPRRVRPTGGIASGGQAPVGIQIPGFEFQEISDTVPASAVWWDPTNGDDANSGSLKQLAKKSFAAAEAIASTTKRIILAGGGAGSTTYHVVPKIVPTKSGTDANRCMELFAEPGCKVVLVREGDFLGGLTRGWTWTQVNSSLNIWDSPNLGIGDGATSVTIDSEGRGRVTNGLAGFVRSSNGCNSRPHLMKLPWVSIHEMNNTGGGEPNEGGYAGPSVCFLGNGKVRIRLQPPTQAVAGNEWPTDGLMGDLIAPDGTWAEPSATPNDYEIHLVRWDGDFAVHGNKDLFDFAAKGVSWWHIKGINSALINRTIKLGANTGIKFEKCTSYPHWCGVSRHSTSASSIELIRCRHLTGDTRHMSWHAHKSYWWELFPAAHLFDAVDTPPVCDFTLAHCTLFGWSNEGLPRHGGGRITIDHCAILNNVDDAYQAPTDDTLVINRSYCYVFGGPLMSQEGSSLNSTNAWINHHNVYDNRVPMLWGAYGSNARREKGICPNLMYTSHGQAVKAYKHCYNTYVVAADCGKSVGRGVMVVPSDGSKDLPRAAAHEVYNNILAVIASKRYPTPSSTGDSIVRGMSCVASTAGIHRYDYNLYYRQLPGVATHAAFRDVQDSAGQNRQDYNSLAAFRASAQRTASMSMYIDGTDGHEQNGVEENPRFRDLANRDYRPQSPGAISGAKNVTAIIGGTFENWKGALDPDGDGSEVGPQNA